MPKQGIRERLNNPKIKQLLLVFSEPKTPKRAQHELVVRKLKLKPFLEKNLLQCLNPSARKGRYYVLSDMARECLKISSPVININKDWDLIGWITSSPRQRLAVIRIMDSRKFTSEELRARATQFNASITRISVKSILRELTGKGIVESELLERLRFYWLNEYGQKIKDDLAVIAPISPLFS